MRYGWVHRNVAVLTDPPRLERFEIKPFLPDDAWAVYPNAAPAARLYAARPECSIVSVIVLRGWSKASVLPVAVSLAVRFLADGPAAPDTQCRFQFKIVICRRSSARLEQRSFKPMVQGSNPCAGTSQKSPDLAAVLTA